jgi:hypothetical protein
VVLIGASFHQYLSICAFGQQICCLGNNWATKISNKVQLGNKKEKKVNL